MEKNSSKQWNCFSLEVLQCLLNVLIHISPEPTTICKHNAQQLRYKVCEIDCFILEEDSRERNLYIQIITTW